MDERSMGKIMLYRHDDGSTDIKVRLTNETVWLSQQQIAQYVSYDS